MYFVAVLDGRVLLDTITTSRRCTFVRALEHLPECRPRKSVLTSRAKALADWADAAAESGRLSLHVVAHADVKPGSRIDL